MVRQGKNCKDHTVYLTDKAIRALQGYLNMRGPGPTDHVFFYRHRPVSKDLIRARVLASGKRVGVKVTPHRLRHTCATQLLNAGCKVTSIQKFLGHQRIDTTMIYAQVHNKSVSDDYYAAMSRIEKQLDLVDTRHENLEKPISGSERNHLLLLIDQLAENQVQDAVLGIAEEMHYLLDSSQTDLLDVLATNKDCSLESKSMPVFVIAEVR